MGKVDVVAALEDLLEAERALVLTGDVGALEQLAGRKEALLAALAGAEVTPAALERLRLGLDRNARVLSAAGQGIRGSWPTRRRSSPMTARAGAARSRRRRPRCRAAPERGMKLTALCLKCAASDG
jgi:hypothetical protein